MPEPIDIHKQTDTRDVPAMVGFDGIDVRLPLVTRFATEVPVQARLKIQVSLDANKRGVHLSRIMECVGAIGASYDDRPLEALCELLSARLFAKVVEVEASFVYPWQVVQTSAEYIVAPMSCDARLRVEKVTDVVMTTLHVRVPVMTVCPCSLALTDGKAAHAQRAYVSAAVRSASNDMIWIEDIATILAISGSAPIYNVLKRPGEKALVEAAFANPKFAEDTLRDAVVALRDLRSIEDGRPLLCQAQVEVQSQESVHPFDVIASAGFGIHLGM